MSTQWTYLKHDNEGGLLESERGKLPPKSTAFLAFDTFRWKVQVGVREDGGYMSLLLPYVSDDCMVAAWAPFGCSEPLSEALVKENVPELWHTAINENYAADGMTLMLATLPQD